MWDWSPRGIDSLLNEAQAAALDRLNRGPGSALEVEIAEEMNRYVAASERALATLLPDLLARAVPPRRTLGADIQTPAEAPVSDEEVRAVAGPPPEPPEPEEFRGGAASGSLLGRLLGGRPGEPSPESREDYEAAMNRYRRELEEWTTRVASVRTALEREREERRREAERQNAGVAEAQARLLSGPLRSLQAPIVETVNALLQGKDTPPLDVPLPRSISIAFEEAIEQVVIEARLPGAEVVPPRAFEPAGDFMPRAVPRSDEETTQLYRRYAASVAVAVLHAAYLADAPGRLRAAAFHGYVRRGEEHPGQEREAYVVSARPPRDRIREVPLNDGDPVSLLEGLGGRVTTDAVTLKPVERVTGT